MTITMDRVVALVEPTRPTIVNIDAEIKRLDKLHKEMIGFEEIASDKVSARLKELRLEKIASETLTEYRRFVNLSFLSWRDKNRYPKLVLFSLDSPTFSIRGTDWSWDDRITPELPEELRKYYTDVTRYLSQRCRVFFSTKSEIRISCLYSGVIPPETRKKIEQAKSIFKRVFILAEATKWTETSTPKPILDPDPIVVGWNGGDTLYMIDKFDLTPVEKLLAVEFTE